MSRKNKEKALELLKNRDREGMVQWVKTNRSAFRTLSALTFEQDDLIRWRTIEAIGWVMGSKDLAEGRELVRRQFWTMTEESGGTAWHAPEVIGETLANQPELIKEFGVILSSFFKEEPFERGAYWGVARTTALDPATYQAITPQLLSSLKLEDPFIRIQAARALMALGKLDEADSALLEKLKNDAGVCVLYDFDKGDLQETSVAAALAALA